MMFSKRPYRPKAENRRTWMPDTEQQLLSMTEEAAVLIQRGRATFANAPAREILGEDCTGKRLAALFGEAVSGAQAASFLAQVRLREKPYLVRIARLGQDQVCFLRPQEDAPAVMNQPFLSSLRSSLMNMELAADRMRSLAEESASVPLLENLRSLTRSQYQIRRLLDNASLILEQSRGGAVCAPRVFDLSGLCRSSLEAMGTMLPGISFPDRCGEGIPVYADPRLIKILLLNLLSNAVCHGEGCSRISLSLLEAGQTVVLGVDDDGCGIREEELPRVFDRYRHDFRLDQMHAGPGLGLTAVRMIAQAHSGSLLLESRAGQGTTVRVSLRRPRPEQLRSPREEVLFHASELLTGLADCLPSACFGEKWLD